MQDESFFSGTGLTDDQLLENAKGASSDAISDLFLRYEVIAKTLVKGYAIAGMEQDDLVQEALMGLVKAVDSFNSSLNVPFRAYALICMRRQVNTAIKTGLGGKQQPLSNYVPLDDSENLLLYKHGSTQSPEFIIITDEDENGRQKQIKKLLSTFEQNALRLYLSGVSYEEAAKQMHTTQKAIDNALQRVRRKLRGAKY